MARPTDPAPAAATAPAADLLRATALTKSYRLGNRAVAVLRGVDVSLARGEFLVLRGASGAGKSTLLHLLGGLDVPDAGHIWFDGRNLATLGNAALTQFRNRRIGFVFQAYHLLPELDALENVCLPARLARTRVPEAEARGRELLARVGLAERADHRPAELSGGEQQRVAIARALMNQPDVLLADEPTGNLDSQTGAQIIQLLASLWEDRQVTLIIATHDPQVATRAPRVAELVDGRIR
ncbi:MAG: ABC transporter ATP-binding protein [Verrucomicrobia bacterium]|nr:ABC transporter ATP-binding protein [Verrucomicrobiota bacterium]